MKELLQKLQIGVKKSTLDRHELKNLFVLTSANLIKDSEFLKLPSDQLIGKIFLSSAKRKKPDGYLQPIGTKNNDLIVENRDLNGAKQNDFVLAQFAGMKRGRKSAKVLFIAGESQNKIVAYINNFGNKTEVLDIENGEPIYIKTKTKELKTLPDQTVVTIDQHSGEIDEILGVLSDPKVDEEIVLRKYSRIDRFSSQILQEAKSYDLVVEKSQYPNRVDLTDLPFVTIDPVDAKDFDDAVYFDIEKNTIFVAIADVSSYVNEFSHIDKEARKRGFTVYLPHKSVPMLPRELSENICSLKPNEDRLAFVFELELDSGYKVKNYKLFEAVIRSKHRYNYDRIDELLNGAKFDDQDRFVKNWIFELKNTILHLRKNRLKKGFSFYNPDVRIELDSDLNFVKTRKEEETISHQLIEECMLLANCAASEFFTFGIFRTHEQPSQKSLDTLVENLSELDIFVSSQKSVHKFIEEVQNEAKKADLVSTVDRLLIRSLKRAQYTYENVGHFGLGFAKYTHFTSPIRRYSDLILHRYIKAIINKEQKKLEYISSSLQRVAPQVTELENEVAKIEWQYTDRVYARWAAKNIGVTLNGEVIDDGNAEKDAVVIIDDEQISGLRCYMQIVRKSKLRIRKFSRVKVMITDSDIASARISAKFVGFDV